MKILATYTVSNEGVTAEVAVMDRPEEFVNTYELQHAHIKEATRIALNYLKEKIIESVQIKVSELLDPREAEKIRKRVVDKAHQLVHDELSGLSKEEEQLLVGRLTQEMLGLGELELILSDENLEEIVVNSAQEPVWVYHKKFGWLKTNVVIASEEQIHNYSSIIGRKVGRQITNLNPLMDAHLLSGNRVNATLFPISTKGNSLTIRKFSKDPWTMMKLVDNNTLSLDAAALFWLCMQYEMNVLVAGGTASGKTSFLNSILAFTPPNQRVVSIEDTRELILPDFIHWTPLTTRQPNHEGKGEITMLDLMVNSLRMRPDRIVLGEMRRQNEAEVLFEAMHTGHAVYSTIHADQAAQVRSRLTNPPIGLPENMLEALHLVVVQYRQRRTGARRTFEVAEILPHGDGICFNQVYKWNARTDKLSRVGKLKRLAEELELHAGFTPREIDSDLKDKRDVLAYLQANKLSDVNGFGRVVASYYRDSGRVMEAVKKKKPPAQLLGG